MARVGKFRNIDVSNRTEERKLKVQFLYLDNIPTNKNLLEWMGNDLINVMSCIERMKFFTTPIIHECNIRSNEVVK